jgi:hypothetical protein
MPKVRWGTITRNGDTCFTGLTTCREATARAQQWSLLFPLLAPYGVTRNGRSYNA